MAILYRVDDGWTVNDQQSTPQQQTEVEKNSTPRHYTLVHTSNTWRTQNNNGFKSRTAFIAKLGQHGFNTTDSYRETWATASQTDSNTTVGAVNCSYIWNGRWDGFYRNVSCRRCGREPWLSHHDLVIRQWKSVKKHLTDWLVVS